MAAHRHGSNTAARGYTWRLNAGHRVCLVSSGAVGLGCQVLRLQERPTDLAKKQALAAVGQGALLRLYTDLFSTLSLVCLPPVLCAAC